jgi:hypothetical protein
MPASQLAEYSGEPLLRKLDIYYTSDVVHINLPALPLINDIQQIGALQ